MNGWSKDGAIRTKPDFIEAICSPELQRLRDNAERRQPPVGLGRDLRWSERMIQNGPLECKPLELAPCWRGFVADSLPGVE